MDSDLFIGDRSTVFVPKHPLEGVMWRRRIGYGTRSRNHQAEDKQPSFEFCFHILFKRELLVAGIGVGFKVNLDVFNRINKQIQTFLRVIQQCLARNHQLPLAVPHRAPDQPVVGEVVGRNQWAVAEKINGVKSFSK